MSDDKCLVNSCCCGCTLRTGALVTGILSLIGGILGLAVSVYATVATGIAIGWLSAVIYALITLVAILLLHGVRTENTKLVRVWVYTQIVLMILLGIGTLIRLFQQFDLSDLLSNLVTIAVQTYLIIVVRSYAIQLESGGGAVNPA